MYHEVEDETDGVDTQPMSTEPELIVEPVVETLRGSSPVYSVYYEVEDDTDETMEVVVEHEPELFVEPLAINKGKSRELVVDSAFIAQFYARDL